MYTGTSEKSIIVFLGNLLMSDDKIGIILGERLKEKLEKKGLKVEILEKTGFELIDYLSGYEKAVIVDSVVTGKKTGELTIYDLRKVDFIPSPSPHASGILDAIYLMDALGLSPPQECYLIGIEVKDPYTISESISPVLEKRIPELEKKVFNIILSLLFKQNLPP